MLLGAGVVGLAPLTSQAQQRPTLPSQQHATVQSSAAVAQQTLPAVNTAALRAEDRERTGRIGPYRYGTTLDADFSPERHGTWEQLPSGRWLWRLRLQSTDAVSLSLGFSPFHLPPGATLYLHGPGDTIIHGPYTAADATAGEHWTPLVPGEQVILELEVPAGRRSGVSLTVAQVVHGYRALPGRANGPSPKSGSCNLDVACEEADPWREQVRSVARYTFEASGSTFFCSGALVNNTAEDKTPYFLTAEHCVSTPEQAASMVFYWNYQNQTCRALGSPENGQETDDNPGDQTSSGAVLRARYGNWHQEGQITGKSDLALVEVDDQIPTSYNLYLSGWSRAGNATAEGVTIHHPSGDGKRISFDRDSTRITGYATSGDTHLRVGNWETGTTEGGSSGGPLFNTEQRIVGVLSGGRAGCKFDGATDDNDEPDWYGRVAPGFRQGDYNGTTLADVLDPLNTGTATLDGQPQSSEIDRTAPAAARDLRVRTVEPGTNEVTLAWTAPGDDNRTGTAQKYDLRYDTTRIETAADFTQATPVDAPPLPSPAGTQETAVVGPSDGLRSGRSYYFAVVAEDQAGNRSPKATPQRKAVLAKQIKIEEGGLTTGVSTPISETAFVLTETQKLTVSLYDVLGRRVRTLLRDRKVQAGFEQRVRVRTTSLPSGTYFLRFVGQTFATTRKVVVVN